MIAREGGQETALEQTGEEEGKKGGKKGAAARLPGEEAASGWFEEGQ